MPSSSDPVLLDNCAISACTELGAWDAVVARYVLETVDEVASEAATGSTHRRIIDPRQFRAQVKIHHVSDEDRLEREAEHGELAFLDDGEKDLWVHALMRTDGWVLCGPDAASIRFGVKSGNADRLISLEELFAKIGYNAAGRLKPHHTAKWLRQKISEYKLEFGFQSLSSSSTSRG